MPSIRKRRLKITRDPDDLHMIVVDEASGDEIAGVSRITLGAMKGQVTEATIVLDDFNVALLTPSPSPVTETPPEPMIQDCTFKNCDGGIRSSVPPREGSCEWAMQWLNDHRSTPGAYARREMDIEFGLYVIRGLCGGLRRRCREPGSGFEAYCPSASDAVATDWQVGCDPNAETPGKSFVWACEELAKSDHTAAVCRAERFWFIQKNMDGAMRLVYPSGEQQGYTPSRQDIDANDWEVRNA